MNSAASAKAVEEVLGSLSNVDDLETLKFQELSELFSNELILSVNQEGSAVSERSEYPVKQIYLRETLVGIPAVLSRNEDESVTVSFDSANGGFVLRYYLTESEFVEKDEFRSGVGMTIAMDDVVRISMHTANVKSKRTKLPILAGMLTLEHLTATDTIYATEIFSELDDQSESIERSDLSTQPSVTVVYGFAQDLTDILQLAAQSCPDLWMKSTVAASERSAESMTNLEHIGDDTDNIGTKSSLADLPDEPELPYSGNDTFYKPLQFSSESEWQKMISDQLLESSLLLSGQVDDMKDSSNRRNSDPEEAFDKIQLENLLAKLTISSSDDGSSLPFKRNKTG